MQKLTGAFAVALIFTGIVSSGAVAQQNVIPSGYVVLDDIREFSGIGFAAETTHNVRLEFTAKISGTSSSSGTTSGSSSSGSTTATTSTTSTSSTSSTSATSGTSTAGTTTSPPPPPPPPTTTGTTGTTIGPDSMTVKVQSLIPNRAVKTYRLKPRRWLFAPGQKPLRGEGIVTKLTADDYIEVPPSLAGSARIMATGGMPAPDPTPTPVTTGSTGTTTGSTTTTGSSTTGSNTTTTSTGSTAGSSAGTSAGGGSGTWSNSTITNYFGVASSFFSALTTDGNSNLTTTFQSGSITAYQITAFNQKFWYRLPGAANRNVYFIQVTHYESGHYGSNGQPVVDVSQLTKQLFTSALNTTRRDVPTLAIDSRKAYGQANLDGELPGDPNAELANMHFVGWSYKGGLFVGNAPYGANDLSGTARIQAYVPTATFTSPLLSSYTLLPLGRPGKFPGGATYKAYTPSNSDPNLGLAYGTQVRWDKRWDLATATQVGAALTLNSSYPANEYARFLVPGAGSNLFVALDQESDYVNGSVGAWQYFSTPAYEAVFNTTYPISDSRPRIWTVDLTSTTSVSIQ